MHSLFLYAALPVALSWANLTITTTHVKHKFLVGSTIRLPSHVEGPDAELEKAMVAWFSNDAPATIDAYDWQYEVIWDRGNVTVYDDPYETNESRVQNEYSIEYYQSLCEIKKQRRICLFYLADPYVLGSSEGNGDDGFARRYW